jgi:hypothetical protein
LARPLMPICMEYRDSKSDAIHKVRQNSNPMSLD